MKRKGPRIELWGTPKVGFKIFSLFTWTNANPQSITWGSNSFQPPGGIPPLFFVLKRATASDLQVPILISMIQRNLVCLSFWVDLLQWEAFIFFPILPIIECTHSLKVSPTYWLKCKPSSCSICMSMNTVPKCGPFITYYNTFKETQLIVYSKFTKHRKFLRYPLLQRFVARAISIARTMENRFPCS